MIDKRKKAGAFPRNWERLLFCCLKEVEVFCGRKGNKKKVVNKEIIAGRSRKHSSMAAGIRVELGDSKEKRQIAG